MKSSFDIIEYPFIVDESNKPFVVKTKEGYEAKICFFPDSKKITATKNKIQQKLLHIRIKNGKCKIVGRSDSIYSFSTPADFYLDIPNESRNFYEKIFNDLVKGNMNDCLNVAELFYNNYTNAELPKYPIPDISSMESYESYNFKSCVNERTISDTIQVKYLDDIPECPVFGLDSRLKASTPESLYNFQEIFIKNLFSEKPIIRLSNIEKEFNKEFVDTKSEITIGKLKRFFPLHAYFYLNGPWRGCWVKYGYDPRKNRDSYKYQIFDDRQNSTNIQVFENSLAVKEVDKNKDWYLKDTCDFKLGFFTPSLLKLLKYGSNLNLPEEENDKDLEFEVFD